MSLGMFHVLPLVKGWEWLPQLTYQQTLNRGAELEYEFRGTGWMMGMVMASTDENARVQIRTRSGKAGMKIIYDVKTIDNKFNLAVDATGFAIIYMKTNATSSAGFFVNSLFNGWGTGSLLPFLDRTRVKLMLGSDSTQENAFVFWSAGIINIINISLFVRSLREIQGTRNMLIDPALIEFAEQFPEEK